MIWPGVLPVDELSAEEAWEICYNILSNSSTKTCSLINLRLAWGITEIRYLRRFIRLERMQKLSATTWGISPENLSTSVAFRFTSGKESTPRGHQERMSRRKDANWTSVNERWVQRFPAEYLQATNLPGNTVPEICSLSRAKTGDREASLILVNNSWPGTRKITLCFLVN